jgi:predicted metal-binding membrane protein
MFGMIRTADDAHWYRLTVVSLIAAAWGVLALWGVSPFAGLLSHGEIGAAGLAPLLRLAIFTLGWTLMTIAMMLPGSLPLVNLFRHMLLRRVDRNRLLALLLIGYLAVWVIFGGFAYAGDSALHEAVERSPFLAANAGGIAGVILLVAGLYQFTPLKRMCLAQCRSPYSFLVEHWTGQGAGLAAFRLGVRHGLFCLGCCWTLMLLMFAIGSANLGWMLALGAVMAAERTSGWGRQLTYPLGLILLWWARLVLAGQLPFPTP